MASGLIALGCLGLTGCSGGGGGGPLAGGAIGTLCAPVANGQVLSDGFQDLRNPGDAPATIEAVTLADPDNLVLLAAYIIPIAGYDLYGVRAGFPPAAGLDPGVLWSKRHVAAGASVPHSDGPHVSNLLLVLKPTASTGTADGVWISYRLAGQDYRFRTTIKLVVVVGRSCPSS